MELSLIYWFGLGVVIFIFTGLDDLCIVYLLFKQKSRNQKIQIFIGTLAGVLIMLFLCVGLSTSLILTLKKAKKTMILRLPGIIPLVFGFLYLRKLSDFKAQEKTIYQLQNQGLKYLIILALSIYLGNSIDDLSVNTSVLVNATSHWQVIFLCLGNLIGTIILIAMAVVFDQLDEILEKFKFEKLLQWLAAIILMFIGLLILSGTLEK